MLLSKSPFNHNATKKIAHFCNGMKDEANDLKNLLYHIMCHLGFLYELIFYFSKVGSSRILIL